MRIAALLGVLVAMTAAPAAADDPCAHVDCGENGRCIREMEVAYCFCDEGYAAVGLTCEPVRFEVPRRHVTGREIVAIALAEVRHRLSDVGRHRESGPGPLADFVPPEGLWCSDFVSWVYRNAGVPLTGGYEGGWLVTNNNSIRAWFERRGWWIDDTDPRFRVLEPRPGDYVRIRTRTWGHSAIVERVDGTTLHLIEGNARGRVRRVRYANYREHPKVDGFGLVSFADVRLAALRPPRAPWRPVPSLPLYAMLRRR